jgi:hypothetical protein
MTRSILWISSNAPSSLLPMACVALPQPRSRMAFAADTFAAAVASFDRMTPTRTLSAVRVWLRASDRISVMLLTIFDIMPRQIEGWNIFARRRVCVIRGQVAGPRRRAERGRRKDIGSGLRLSRATNGMISALTTTPPTLRWRPCLSGKAISGKLSCWPLHDRSLLLRGANRPRERGRRLTGSDDNPRGRVRRQMH